MTRLGLRLLLARPRPLALSALAVTVGVALVAGAYVVTDSSSKALARLTAGPYRGATAVVVGERVLDDATSPSAGLPRALVARLARIRDVRSASGIVFDPGSDSGSVRLLDRRGRTIGSDGAPTYGVGIDPGAGFEPLRVVRGRLARVDGAVAVDRGTADREHLGVGDTVRAAARGPAQPFRIVGVVDYPALGGGTLAVFALGQAQALLGTPDRVDAIALTAAPGVSARRLVAEVFPLVPATAAVRTGAGTAGGANTRFVSFIRTLLLVFAALALVVGAIVVLNALSIATARRTRELALLRMLGATRALVLRLVLVDAIAVAVVGSVAGIGLGVALERAIGALLAASGAALPLAGVVVTPATVAVSLAAGVAACLAAAVGPARRAARIAPLAALTEAAVEPATLPGRALPAVVAAAATALLAVALAASPFALALPAAGLGGAALLVALALAAPRLVARLPTVPTRRLAPRLAQEGVRRNPRLSGATAAALTIGIALTTVVATVAAGVRDSERSSLRGQVSADHVVSAASAGPQLAAATERAVARGGGLASVVLEAHAAAFGSDVRVDGVAPATFARVYRAPALALGPGDALVKRSFASDHHLALGSALTIVTAGGSILTLRVRGVYSPPRFDRLLPLLGPIAISSSTLTAALPSPRTLFVLVRSPPAGLRSALAAFPDVHVDSRERWIDRETADLDQVAGLAYVLLGLAVVVALLGVATSLALALVERSDELRLLRTLGAAPALIARVVVLEGALLGAAGVVLGVLAGLAIGAVVTAALRSRGVVFAVPVVQLIAIGGGGVAAATVAALAPARRFARIDPLARD